MEPIDLKGMIILEQSGVKASGEKCVRSEWNKNITEREKSRAKRENKSILRGSDLRTRKLVWIRPEQAV